ncbi:hypothetical protein L1F30_17015 [Simiduia sp. 21SJ11W-1]|uniref:hypothetical protein n=1 Tax=Simiduia sp. 21SJ11W-1 TaxID=2909669 RepID=UPI0020A0FE05|nr:hypothetical protein [Simiduia sp. 21SJ11W-1]UTA47842.1 hypothetical protein L1F30_17015 [Simiduia sp. 21SJ11W-1]
MEQNKFFITVNRINSVLILLAALGVVIFTLVVSFVAGGSRSGNTVTVAESEAASEQVEYQLGNVKPLAGHSSSYLELRTAQGGRGFKSGYGSGSIRNILLINNVDLSSRWLFETHANLINCFCELKADDSYNSREPVIAVYLSLINEDSNGDGELSASDAITLVLLSPDGKRYLEVDSGIDSILDSTVSVDATDVTFIVRKGQDILAKNFSLENFSLLAESRLAGIN